ncbi:hypothetical protein DB30_05390 [Enhygromyxa salina]|uniref:Uncharacterized protein n=1 Tax=Enhygromyxa salina TaxID=215803 RepID=A0A0C2D6G3_9BACT|nr:hypothetical protein [Enhygromyxa salina]KIG15642.1 hypothetical protein DB30_05390 [Enhygromyxa salina]
MVGFEVVEFNYTGAATEFEVPAWVTNLTIEVWGAEGGDSECCGAVVQDDGGEGGDAVATLYLYVGGQGVLEGAGGFNGGGAGGEWGGGGGAPP